MMGCACYTTIAPYDKGKNCPDGVGVKMLITNVDKNWVI